MSHKGLGLAMGLLGFGYAWVNTNLGQLFWFVLGIGILDLMLNYKDEQVQMVRFFKTVGGMVVVFIVNRLASGDIPNSTMFMHVLVGMVLLVQLTQMVPTLVQKILSIIPKKDISMVDKVLQEENAKLQAQVEALLNQGMSTNKNQPTGMGPLGG